ncbi:MAG TPA: Holliday junction resolvase RuvX [Candidatus Saccharimonadales bacterium]|nr:Holliday junction resolvase RuvX [Candidatus Saccharimonadales bacterium]
MARRFLGVDYGAKRVGLAIADDAIKVARPWRIIERDHLPLVDTLRSLITSEGITDIVLGLPRNLDGDDTAQTAEVRQFAQDLERLGLPVTLQDEALTSQNLPSSGQAVDDAAAAQILQDYLENH